MAENDFETNVVEAVDTELHQQLALRRDNISNYEMYGPPDLCYLVKSKQIPQTFGKKKIIQLGSFHYVFGVDTSSAATIAAYVQ